MTTKNNNGKPPELHMVDTEKEAILAIARELLEGTDLDPADVDDNSFWEEVYAEERRRNESQEELRRAEAESKNTKALAAAREKRAKLEAERKAEVDKISAQTEEARKRLGTHVPTSPPMRAVSVLPHPPVIVTPAADPIAKFRAREEADKLREKLDSLRERLGVKLPDTILYSLQRILAMRGELCRVIMQLHDILNDEDLPDREVLVRQKNAVQEWIEAVNTILRDGFNIEPHGQAASSEVYQSVRLELFSINEIARLLRIPEPPPVESAEERQKREEAEKRQAEKSEARRATRAEIETRLKKAGAAQDVAARMADSIAKRDGDSAADKLIAAGVGKLLHAEQAGSGQNGDAVHDDIALAELYAKAAGIKFDELQERYAAHKKALADKAESQAKAVAKSVPIETRSTSAQLRDDLDQRGKKGKPDGAKNKRKRQK